MRRIPVAIITLVGSLVVAACSGRDATSPRSIAPDGAKASNTPPTASLTCDFTAIKAAARNYFTSSQDAVFGYISDMQKAYGAANYDVATAIGWKIGRQVATERLGALTTDGSAGAIFVIDVLRCMGTATSPLAIPQSFLDSAARVLNAGIWEIRGGPSSATSPRPNPEYPAAARVLDSTFKRAFGQPRWGVEPLNGTWPGTSEYAVFGYPSTNGTLLASSLRNINTNDATYGAENAFELGTIPDTPNHNIPGTLVGVCLHTDNATTQTANRIIHDNSEILNPSTLQALCRTTITGYVALAPAAQTWYANLFRRAGALLSPRDAFAFDDCSDCIGGLPSGWSPFTTSGLAAGSISLSYYPISAPQAPHDGNVSDVETVVVQDLLGSTPIPGVVVTISIAGNSGQSGGAYFDDATTATVENLTSLSRTSDANGLVTFKFSILKAGGYTLATGGTLDKFPLQNTLTTAINIKNK